MIAWGMSHQRSNKHVRPLTLSRQSLCNRSPNGLSDHQVHEPSNAKKEAANADPHLAEREQRPASGLDHPTYKAVRGGGRRVATILGLQPTTETSNKPRQRTARGPDLLPRPPILIASIPCFNTETLLSPATLVHVLCEYVHTCKTSPSTEAPGRTTLSTWAPPAASESLRCLRRSATAAGFPKFSHFERSPIVGKPSDVGGAITTKKTWAIERVFGVCFCQQRAAWWTWGALVVSGKGRHVSKVAAEEIRRGTRR